MSTADERLRALDDDLRVVDAPQRCFGFEIGTRVTVVRLRSGELWLCSLIPIDDALAAALTAPGPIKHLVGPNRSHHLYLGPAQERFDGATLHLAPGLADKRTDLAAATTLSDEAPDAWAGQIDQQVFGGVPMFNELAFLHRASRTLVLTDPLFHLDEHTEPASARVLGRLLGVHHAPGLPRDAKALFVRDKAALRAVVGAILAWDFDRIVLTHGQNVAVNGRNVLRAAYEGWLL